jgi:lipopolysaccharide export system permease protein
VIIKILDRYLIKQFLQTVIFGLIAFTLIFVVIDAMENLDDFIDQNVPTEIILQYYFVFTPEMIKLMTPVAVLFAALFTAGKAANLSELTAIKASGVSLYRFMAPFIATTILITFLSIYFGGFVVPSANRIKINIEQVYLKKNLSFTGSNIYFQDTKTRIVSISYFDDNLDQANRVSIQDFDQNDLTRMVGRIDASRLSYDTTSNIWRAHNGVRRVFTNKQEAVYFELLEIDNLNFSPDDLLAKQRKIAEMNLTELEELIAAQRRAGNDPTPTLIEYHSRFAFAVTPLIVVLFGLPISANKRKGGVAAQVGINILVTFLYLVFMKISQAFGKNGALDPLLTAWTANLIFLAGAVYNVWRSRM